MALSWAMLPPKIDESEVVVVPLFLWQQHLDKKACHEICLLFM
jgi:hypothetical protein